MRSRIQRALIVTVLVIGMMPAGLGSAFGTRAIDDEYPLVVAPGGQVQPDIDWPYVAFKDGRYDDMWGGEPHIRIYNMETGRDFPVTPENMGLWEQSNPSISGTKVVYSDQRSVDETTGCDVWMYDIKTGVETQLTDAPNGQGNPFIYGDIVAWVDWRSASGYSDIWMMDLASGEETAVSPVTGAHQREPVVWEDYIVWKDSRNSRNSIYLYDLASGEETCVAEGWAAVAYPFEWTTYSDPFVSDGIVVYQRQDYVYNGTSFQYEYSIEMFDIASGDTTTVSTETARNRWHPVTRDGWITWTDTRKTGSSEQMEVWGYNLETEEEVLLVAAEAAVSPGEVNGAPEWFKYAGRSTVGDGWVLWHDHRPWDGDDDRADLYAKYLGEGAVPTQKMPLEGQTRYQTAIDISRQSFPSGSDAVVIATGQQWPDALAGASLAAAYDAPILLVDRAYPDGMGGWELPADIVEEIERLGAWQAIILGGELAVSAEVELALQGMGHFEGVSRLGGANRFETACLIAEEVVAVAGDGWDGTAFVTTGRNFPDALAASPLAGWAGYPVFLSQRDGIPADTKQYMDDLAVQEVIVLGGTVAVPLDVVVSLQATGIVERDRVGGDNRYETAALIANYGVDELGMSFDTLGMATGATYPDALSMGAALGREGNPMMLTARTSLPSFTKAALEADAAEISQVRFAGGPLAITQAVRDAIMACLN